MAKSHSVFICDQCGYSQAKWSGKCPTCNTWGSMVESLQEKSSTAKANAHPASLISLSTLKSEKLSRAPTGISELDRVLGGGLVPGHVVLLAGEPGIGKSTLLLQVASKTAQCVYVAGEESPTQIKIRSERLGLGTEGIDLLDATDVDMIIATLEQMIGGDKKPTLVVVDSIQTISTKDLIGIPGSVGQVRECAHRLTKFAKRNRLPIVLVGQITKGGSVAGPATLAHMVDTVCWFEGEPERDLRILRTIKNRFGATDEIGVFRMQEEGLVSVSNIESTFLSGKAIAPGSAIASVLEGSRPMLVEVQSLVVPSKLPVPRRVASGIDTKRVDVILAVLAKHAGLAIYDKDVFVNVVGGILVKEPGVDLAIALSLASSVLNKPFPLGAVAIGEVGLLGEIRPVLRESERIKQAKRQGFKTIFSGGGTSQTSLKEVIKKAFHR